MVNSGVVDNHYKPRQAEYIRIAVPIHIINLTVGTFICCGWLSRISAFMWLSRIIALFIRMIL